MSYRRESIGHDLHYIFDGFHLAIGKIGIVAPTEDEITILQYADWRKKINSEIPGEIGSVNPADFQKLITNRIRYLQADLQVGSTFFTSDEIPFERISVNLNGSITSIRFPQLTLDLLKKHPNRNFDRKDEQGIEFRQGGLWFTVLDERHHQRTFQISENTIKPTDPTELRFLVAAAAWALDPERI